MKRWFVQNRYSVAFLLLIICLACSSISKSYGFYFPADEFGYWSYAARLAGYDWSDIASLSSYYSWGYSLILFPVFLIFKDGVTAYRAALSVNFLMLAACFLVLRRIEKDVSPFWTAAAVFYPAWFFYAGTTFAELLLVTLYIILCSLFAAYVRTEKRSVLTLLFLVMTYMYFVHMRLVGILITGVAVLLACDLANGKKRIKYMLFLITCMVLALAAGNLFRQYWTDTVYGQTADSLKNINDYAGQVGKVQYIFTGEGFRNLLASTAGKLFYLGTASFGLAYFGIGYAFAQMMDKENGRRRFFYLFVLLSTAAAVMVSAVGTVYPGRVDALTYGRYHEYVMPVLMIMGLKALGAQGMSAHRAACGIAVTVTLEAVLLGMIIWSLREYGQTSFFGNTICGISWLYDAEGFEPVSFYEKVYLAESVLTVLFCMGAWWTGRKKSREIFLILIVAVQIAAGIRLSSVYVDDSRLGCFRDTLVAQKIQELNARNDRAVYYSTGGKEYGNIAILQFMLRDTEITIVKDLFDLNDQSPEDLLLTDYRSGQGGLLGQSYDSHMTYGHFSLYYNEGEQK